jgi:hypothetical protein
MGENVEHRTSNVQHRTLKGEENDDPTSLGSYEGLDEEFPNDESVEKIRNSKFEIRNRRERLQGITFQGSRKKIRSHHSPLTIHDSPSSPLPCPLIPFHSKINNRQSSIVNEIGGVFRDGLTIEDC